MRAFWKIWVAETKKDALAAFNMFVDTYGTSGRGLPSSRASIPPSWYRLYQS